MADLARYFKRMVTGQVDVEMFKEMGLQSTKTLIKYDVWEPVPL